MSGVEQAKDLKLGGAEEARKEKERLCSKGRKLKASCSIMYANEKGAGDGVESKHVPSLDL